MDKLLEITEIKIYFILLFFVLGSVFGSFTCCFVWRKTRGLSIIKDKRSICDVCGHKLYFADLVPIFSFLFLKGKCRYCGNKVPVRYMLFELFSALFFTFAFLKTGISLELAIILLIYCVLTTAALYDMETRTIPNIFFIVLACAWALFEVLKGLSLQRMLYGLVSSVIISLSLVLVSAVTDKVSGKESLGGGDIKLVFSICLFLGLFKGFLFVFLMSIIGILYAVITKKNKGDSFPFGPEIAAAAIAVLVFSEEISSIINI